MLLFQLNYTISCTSFILQLQKSIDQGVRVVLELSPKNVEVIIQIIHPDRNVWIHGRESQSTRTTPKETLTVFLDILRKHVASEQIINDPRLTTRITEDGRILTTFFHETFC
jgi:hypothetical protein